MPWIESNWAYDTLGRVTSQTVQKGANVGGAPEQVAQQVLSYLGNDDPASLVHTLGPATGVVNTKTFTFGYDLRHQLTSAVASQSALGGTGPFAGGANAFTGTYDFGNAGRMTKADVGVGAAALTGSDVKTRKVDYCYHNTDKEPVSALRLITTGTMTHCDPAIRDPHDTVEPGELSPNQTAATTYASIAMMPPAIRLSDSIRLAPRRRAAAPAAKRFCMCTTAKTGCVA